MPSPSYPTLFISHGSPMVAVDGDPARRAWQHIGAALPRPRAVLMLSPHWASSGPVQVASAPRQSAEHDFHGFPAELYRLSYETTGARDVADRALSLLAAAGIEAEPSARDAIDHGMWIPLAAMYPDGDVPLVQLAQPHVDAAGHMALGRALAPLRAEGVLLIGSGSLTHNLRAVNRSGRTAPVPAWVEAFRRWAHAALERADAEALADYRARAPEAARNHPTDEHLLPLHFAFAAGGEGVGLPIHVGAAYGVLAMDVLAFGAEGVPIALAATRRTDTDREPLT
ncbi:MAG: dioxygenase [Burkholderiales bacterium]|nr:MAG: dioxygenase [Burkholderiales bacterium]